MNEGRIETIRDIIQEDVGARGLRTVPGANLITACSGDFQAACKSLAQTGDITVAVVTGFFIPHAEPPCGETDGPLGALFLARALVPLGIKVILVTDPFCEVALRTGLASCVLRKQVPIIVLPSYEQSITMTPKDYWDWFASRSGTLTHLIALERVGPSHTPDSLRARNETASLEQFLTDVPAKHHDRCHTMKGRDITPNMSPAHWLFQARHPGVTTIGIGDGGNEIGMGKIPWATIRANIPGGGLVACRIATDYLIVCGVSNWGAYGLAAGVRLLRARGPDTELFDPEREKTLLAAMVESGPLVDGVTGAPTVSVDGLPFERYVESLTRIGALGV